MISLQKNILKGILAVTLLLNLTSCGEDRTHEYDELTSENSWIYKTMSEYYLYYEDLPKEEDVSLFGDGPAFFKSLLSSKDKFSHTETKEVETKSDNEAFGYGIEYQGYIVKNDSVIAKVLYVYPNSPAAEAGLRRGDLILAFDGKGMSKDNIIGLLQGEDITEAKEVKLSRGNIQLPAPRNFTEDPFFANKVITLDNQQKVGYLMYNSFVRGKNDDDYSYDAKMKNIFADFKTKNLDYFILDLRYNLGGDVVAAQILGSLLAKADVKDKTFFSLKYNDKVNKTIAFTFDSKLINFSTQNINLSKLYIITSERTASASEIIINGLRPYLSEENVVLVGNTTFGKNVAAERYEEDEFPTILWPIVATNHNVDGFSDYADGFDPDFKAVEEFSSNLAELGDVNDELLAKTLYVIQHGSLPAENNNESAAETKAMNKHLIPFHNSFDKKPLAYIK